MQKNDWKERLGIVYSTNTDYKYEQETDEDQQRSIPPSQQTLHVYLDRKQRKGKTVTVIEGFIGSAESLKELERALKTHLGTGGTSKDGIIIIQGNDITKVKAHLTDKGFKVK